VEAILITLILVCGTSLALFTSVFRFGIFRKIDLRWAIVLLSYFLAFFVVSPTGYSPRFSTPLLPLAITMNVLLKGTSGQGCIFSIG
jgi:hypothetical protein